MTETTFSHQKANSPEACYTDGGLRSFFVYRDTGVTAATNGKVRVQLVRAAHKSSEAKGGTGLRLVGRHGIYGDHHAGRFCHDRDHSAGRSPQRHPPTRAADPIN